MICLHLHFPTTCQHRNIWWGPCFSFCVLCSIFDFVYCHCLFFCSHGVGSQFSVMSFNVHLVSLSSLFPALRCFIRSSAYLPGEHGIIPLSLDLFYVIFGKLVFVFCHDTISLWPSFYIPLISPVSLYRLQNCDIDDIPMYKVYVLR